MSAPDQQNYRFSDWLHVWFPGQILQKDQEIKDLKQKIAEVMAVMPSISYTADTSSMTPVAPHYSSKFMDANSSGLDPNASVYQPLKKWTSCPHPPPFASQLFIYLFLFFFLWPPRRPTTFPSAQQTWGWKRCFSFESVSKIRRMLYCVTLL